MRSRSRTSMSAFWWALARLVNGKAARLRARRIRLEMTMSDSGPVPRSHSPLVLVRFSRSILGFFLSNQVSQLSRFFIGFRIDGLAEPASQLEQLGARGRNRPAMPRRLALVPHRAMPTLQQRLQTHPKYLVVMRAAQPPGRPKLHILYPTRRAGQPRQLVRQLANVLADQVLQNSRKVQLLLLDQLFFLGAILAQVHLFLVA